MTYPRSKFSIFRMSFDSPLIGYSGIGERLTAHRMRMNGMSVRRRTTVGDTKSMRRPAIRTLLNLTDTRGNNY
jgi:hypothetical protein